MERATSAMAALAAAGSEGKARYNRMWKDRAIEVKVTEWSAEKIEYLHRGFLQRCDESADQNVRANKE